MGPANINEGTQRRPIRTNVGNLINVRILTSDIERNEVWPD